MMPTLVQVHVLPGNAPSPTAPALGTSLLGLDNRGQLWCGFLMGASRDVPHGQVDPRQGIQLTGPAVA
jgi:hypothetical protein